MGFGFQMFETFSGSSGVNEGSGWVPESGPMRSCRGLLMGMERFAKPHRKTLNGRLDTQVAKPLADSSFRQLLAQLDERHTSVGLYFRKTTF